jgi:TRAP-type C4-dicarboxylate transport system permease small subunit
MNKLKRWVECGLEVCAGAALFVMMAITLVDVIGRKAFSRPLTGGLELTELMMVVALFFALPLVSTHSQHIVFDVLDFWLRPLSRRVQQALANLFSAALFGSAAWVIARRAHRTMEFGDVTAQLKIPFGPFHMAIAVLLGLTALIHIGLAMKPPKPPASEYLPND